MMGLLASSWQLLVPRHLFSAQQRTHLQCHEAGSDANWKKKRFTTEEFLAAMMSKGRKICALFSVAGVENTIFRVDWLHSVDQGVGADFLGNLFDMILGKLPGNNKDARCKALWEEMVNYYDVHRVADQLKGFSYKNIRSAMKDAPKLRGCNAASCRSLIMFGDLMAKKYLDNGVPKEAAAREAAHHMLMVYQSLSQSATFRKDVMESSSMAFALHFAALRDASEDPAWRVKPKMHLFLEMCFQDCRPNLFWTYRDEDFGGSIGHQSKMKGAWRRTFAYMKHALDLFAMKNSEPRLTSLA